MLVAQNLHKHFAAKTLFQGLNWQIGKGEKIGLVGVNGAGKTTLMKIMAGIEQPDDGRVNLSEGESLAYLPQDMARHGSGTVRERVTGGATALVALQDELQRIEEQMLVADAAAVSELAATYADKHATFSLLEGPALPGRVEDICQGLGFSAEQIDGPVASLSGGWAMRVELARLLVARPDYLLMDEPTNHLDSASLAWLEQFLAGYVGSWVVVSHDRVFLNRSVQSIATLMDAEMVLVPGNYDDFVEMQANWAAEFEAASKQQARKVAHLRAFIDRFGAKASKAKQAQSRQKALAKITPLAPGPKRHRSMRLRLGTPARSGISVMALHDAHKAFGERVLYTGVDVEILRGEKVAILGENGAGKSTLLKMLAGVLPLDAGRAQLGHNVTPFYFAQHQLDMLIGSNTPLDEMQLSMPQGTTAEIRGLLGAFLFDADAVQRRVAQLSGGEKSRLALAKMLARPANFLLLDEPTNHLDLASREVLEEALAGYEGTIVCISHDRYFLEKVATRVLVVDGSGKLAPFAGDARAYFQEQARVQAANKKTPLNQSTPVKEQAQAPERGGNKGGGSFFAQKQAKRAEQKRQRDVQALETDIAAQEARVKAIDAELCRSEVFADGKRAQALMAERDGIEENSLPKLLLAWEKAQAQ